MFCKIFLSCSLYICLVLLLPSYSKASSIYRKSNNSNSRLNALNSTNSNEGLIRTESTTNFSLNNEGIRADCQCKNGLCVSNGKMDVCTCPSGWGLYYSFECKECQCGMGINCTFDVGFFKTQKYCLGPDGITLKNEPCKDICRDFAIAECDAKGRYCMNDKNSYKCGDCKNGYKVSSSLEICLLDTCENGGAEFCMKSGMTCINKEGLGYECGTCLDNFRKLHENEEICLPDNCENFGKDHCSKVNMNCKDMEGGFGYICDECFQDFRREDGIVSCEVETCERFGVNECKELGQHCKDRDNGIGFTCGDCLENFQEENGKCVAKTCAFEGESECKKVNRLCLDKNPAGYICGECGHGFTEMEGSNICTEDFCLSSPCKNNGICKVENGSFVCFCKHPFCGKTCEVEMNPTTSSPLNISTPIPDLKTTPNNSIWTTSERFNWTSYRTTKPSNDSRDYNLTTLELDTTPTSVTETPNITLVDFLTTKPSNYSRDYNLTTSEVRSTPLSTTSVTLNTTTVSPVNKTTIDDTTATRVTEDTTTGSSEKPSTSDRGIQVIFRNDYTIRNLTEVIIKM